MTVQENIVRQTREALNMIFQSARAMPEEKLTWSPAEGTRTALHQLQECAAVTDLYMFMLGRASRNQSEEAATQEMATWTTLDIIEAKAREYTEEYLAVILTIPDADLMNDVQTPWGEVRPMVDILGAHY